MRYGAILGVLFLMGCEAVIPETMANYRALEAAKVTANSQAAYKQCLLDLQASKKAGTTPTSDCETERKLYEIDREAGR